MGCMMAKPSRDRYYLEIAYAVSMRSSCVRRHYGAVIVSEDEIVSTGYNGNVRGEPNCDSIGYCLRHGLPHNDSTQLYGDCRSVHAEQNAMLSASRMEMIGSTMYLAGVDGETGERLRDAKPCPLCMRMIKNTGISRVVTEAGDLPCS